jgi:hypothetical protein
MKVTESTSRTAPSGTAAAPLTREEWDAATLKVAAAYARLREAQGLPLAPTDGRE